MIVSDPAINEHRYSDIPARAVDKAGLSQKAFDWLFGYDYFIAHRSVDGKDYASALYDALTTKGSELDCFLDVKHYGAGGGLTNMQERALRKTTRLIVIVTPQAHDAHGPYLRDEVAEFRRIHPNGIIVPIGNWETLTEKHYPNSQLLPLLPHLPDDICIFESTEQLGEGRPSPQTVAKLVNDFSEERRSTKRLRWIRRFSMLLLILLIAAVGFGIYATLERNTAEIARARAEQTLARSFARTIGLNTYDFRPSPDERDALWELAGLEPTNANVRKRLIDDWIQTLPSLERAFALNARGVHAAIGLNTTHEAYLASRAIDAANVLVDALENPHVVDPQRMETLPYSLSNVGHILAALAAYMNPKTAAAVAARLVTALDKVSENPKETPSNRLASLAEALAAFAGRMDPSAAAPLAKRGALVLAKAIGNDNPKMGDSKGRLSKMSEALAVLAARMNSDDVAAVSAALIKAAEDGQEFDYVRISIVGSGLAALCACLKSNDAVAVSAPLVKALENPQENDPNRLSTLGDTVVTLAAGMNSDAAAAVTERAARVLVRALENAPDSDSGGHSSLGNTIAALAAHMNPNAAADVTERAARVLVRVLEKAPHFDHGDEPWGNTIAALAAHMNPDAAAAVTERAAHVLVGELENASPLKTDVTLSASLAALLARMKPEATTAVAEKGAHVLVRELEDSQDTFYERLSNLADAVATLTTYMKPDAAAALVGHVAPSLIKALENPLETRADRLEHFRDAVAAIAVRMNSDDAASVAVPLVKVFENPQENNPYRLSTLGDALAALAARMDPDTAAAVAQKGALVLVKALKDPREIDSERLADLGNALAGLAAQIPSARHTQLFGLMNRFFGWVPDPRKSQEAEHRDQQTIAKTCSVLNTQDLTEVLKWPFCVGEARKLVLSELEKKTGRIFGGDVWKFVEQAPSLGIKNLDQPAKCPRGEDAINELQALRAHETHKPGLAIPKDGNTR